MNRLNYDELFHEVNTMIEDNPSFKDFVRSVYGSMRQFNVLLGAADALIEQHGLDPEDRLSLVALLLSIMGVGP